MGGGRRTDGAEGDIASGGRPGRCVAERGQPRLHPGRARIVGLVVTYPENQFYPEALEKLSHALQVQGYHILVFMTKNDEGAAQAVIEELLDHQVDGIIVTSVSMSNSLTARCEAAVVLFNRLQDDPKVSDSSLRQCGRRSPSGRIPAGRRAPENCPYRRLERCLDPTGPGNRFPVRPGRVREGIAFACDRQFPCRVSTRKPYGRRDLAHDFGAYRNPRCTGTQGDH